MCAQTDRSQRLASERQKQQLEALPPYKSQTPKKTKLAQMRTHSHGTTCDPKVPIVRDRKKTSPGFDPAYCDRLNPSHCRITDAGREKSWLF